MAEGTGIFRDPVSGLTHLAGAFLGLVGLAHMASVTYDRGGWSAAWPFIVFGVSVILLYSSSAIYHLVHVSNERRAFLRRVDHTMIFVLIAGSYTPFCAVALPGMWGNTIMIIVWALAIGGLLMKAFWMGAPRVLSTTLYVVMGWIAVTAIYPLYQVLSGTALTWLVVGGLFYTFGAVIYALKRPDPFPPHFGFHEIWHLFVLAGTGSHYMSILTLLPVGYP